MVTIFPHRRRDVEDARVFPLATDEDGAGAADFDTAAVFGAGEPEDVTKHPQERSAAIGDVGLIVGSVDLEDHRGVEGCPGLLSTDHRWRFRPWTLGGGFNEPLPLPQNFQVDDLKRSSGSKPDPS